MTAPEGTDAAVVVRTSKFAELVTTNLGRVHDMITSEEFRGNIAALALVRRALATIAENVKVLDRECEGLIAEAMPRNKVVIEGVGQLNRSNGAKKWEVVDEPGLLAQVVYRAMVDPATGEERDLTPVQAARDAIAMMMRCSTVSWKVTALAANDIDHTKFMEQKQTGRTTVSGT